MTNFIDDEWNKLKKMSLNQQYWLKFHKKKISVVKNHPNFSVPQSASNIPFSSHVIST